MSIFTEIITQYIQPLVVTAIGGALAVVGHRWARWFKAKTGVDVDARVTRTLDEGIAAAKEAARKYLKEHGEELEGKAKRTKAVVFIQKKLKALGLPKFAVDVLEQMVEARLQDTRLGN